MKMPRSREERLAYQRGYAAARSNNYPAHHPPMPPVEVVATVLRAAHELRCQVDATIATFGDDDEVSVTLGRYVEAYDRAEAAYEAWLEKEGGDDAVR